VVASFLAAGVPCASPAYLVEWLCDPWQALDAHYLFDSAPEAGSELPALEAARKQAGTQQQQESESF
jgi:hypothetical protein